MRRVIEVDHTDGGVSDSTAGLGHLDEDLHLNFIAPAAQFDFGKFVDSKQPKSTLAVLDFASDKGRCQPAADGVGVIPRAGHQIAREGARADDQIGIGLFRHAQHRRNVLRKMLTIAIQSNDVSEGVGESKVDTHTESRGFASIHRESKAGSSGGFS